MRLYIQNVLSESPLLGDYKDRISVVLAGSRSVGYHVLSSDHDFLALSDHEIYARVADLAGVDISAGCADIPVEAEPEKLGDGAKVDISLFCRDRLWEAFQDYNDVEHNWPMVEEAVKLMDTNACDIMEDALVAWGFDRDWVQDAHRDLARALFDGLI